MIHYFVMGALRLVNKYSPYMCTLACLWIVVSLVLDYTGMVHLPWALVLCPPIVILFIIFVVFCAGALMYYR